MQSAFSADLTGATGFRERGWRLTAGGRGRVGLAVVTDDREKMLIIFEIKGTGWDMIRAGRVKINVQRHIRQPLAYLDTAISELEAGNGRASQAPPCSTPPVRPAQRARSASRRHS